MKIDLSFIHDWSIAIVSAIGGFLWWLGRVVFTNNKRIDLLEHESKHARELRESQDEAIQEIRKDQKKLVEHLLKSK